MITYYYLQTNKYSTLSLFYYYSIIIKIGGIIHCRPQDNYNRIYSVKSSHGQSTGLASGLK